MPDHVLGHATQEQVRQPRAAMSAHHDHLASQVCCGIHDNGPWCSFQSHGFHALRTHGLKPNHDKAALSPR
jgi:hypothetical protein